jgi:hypothetical protein
MIKKIVLVGLFCFNASLASAYFENYPPFRFSQKPPVSFKTNLLVDYDHPEYKSNDGKIIAKLNETSDTFDFLLKVGGVVLQEKKERSTPFAYAVYEGDLDKNNISDFIVFSSERGCGLASQISIVDIYLGKVNGGYDCVHYESLGGGIEDFIDYNKDGLAEILVSDMYGGDKHNYFVYSIYKINNGKLLNANNSIKGFPKFIWYTENKNDKDTKHLSSDEKMSFIKKMDSQIKYSVLKK